MLKLCEDIDTLAMMMLDGELAAQELRDVELHILDCAPCKGHVERERAALELRRRRLAAPPAPMLLRARVQRALDDADRVRRPSTRAYLLPIGASLAAVAALVLFVVGVQGPSARVRSPKADPVDKQRSGFEIQPGGVQNVGGALTEAPSTGVSSLVFRMAGRGVLSDDVAQMHYWAETPDGRRYAIQAIVVDATGMQFNPETRQNIGGYEVWSRAELPQSLLVRDGIRAVLLSSTQLSTDTLIAMVGGSPLISRITADDPRR